MAPHRYARFAIAASFVVVVASLAALSPGELDPAFNGSGKVLSDFGGFASAVLVDDDQQIVVARSLMDIQ